LLRRGIGSGFGAEKGLKRAEAKDGDGKRTWISLFGVCFAMPSVIGGSRSRVGGTGVVRIYRADTLKRELFGCSDARENNGLPNVKP
jgi:hypothetical protein